MKPKVFTPTFSYAEAAKILGVGRHAVSEVARQLNLVREDGKPLDYDGLKIVGEFFHRPVKINP